MVSIRMREKLRVLRSGYQNERKESGKEGNEGSSKPNKERGQSKSGRNEEFPNLDIKIKHVDY